MLPPGRHQLTLTNKELGYSAVEQVDIEPGEVKSVNVNPRGTVNLNAVPGPRCGSTVRSSAIRPRGHRGSARAREFVFKNPQFGERRGQRNDQGWRELAGDVDFTSDDNV